MEKNETRLRELGAAIARERIAQGFTQEELSRRIGNSTHSHLSRVESGSRAPSMNMMFNIADVLGKDVSYFFTKI